MEYEVQDHDQVINDHIIRIRLLNPVIDEDCEDADDPQAYIFMECKSCYLTSQVNVNGSYITITDMNLVDMELHLHAEGFDTEWEPGELQELDHFRTED